MVGSSPRVRGTVVVGMAGGKRDGIIPACAGNRQAFFAIRLLSGGSSPRVRGTADRIAEIDDLSGIIPACAGNSSYGFSNIPEVWDHPRVCGEQHHIAILGGGFMGSSPRVRGTGRISQLSVAGHRIIPACAGNRSSSQPYTCWKWDHPRVCGEQHSHSSHQTCRKGSSPRVRGTDSRRQLRL